MAATPASAPAETNTVVGTSSRRSNSQYESNSGALRAAPYMKHALGLAQAASHAGDELPSGTSSASNAGAGQPLDRSPPLAQPERRAGRSHPRINCRLQTTTARPNATQIPQKTSDE